MSTLPSRLSDTLLLPFKSQKKLRHSFKIITGLAPRNIELYKQAMRHSSVATTNKQGIKNSYERLEYLGDAILGMLVAEHLFAQYPFEEEGFLTVIRSKIVNRESLCQLAIKIGLEELVQFSTSSRNHRSVYGDCMEALIGAFYLDHGFKACKSFVINKLIKPHFDIAALIATTTNYKSKLLEWSQKGNKDLRFEIINEDEKKFTAQVFLNDHPMSTGFGFSKKKAEQDAARKTIEGLNLEE